MRLRAFVVLLAALLVLASGGAVWSQTVQGVITGTITDPTGAVVPNATVTITNVGTNISQTTTTGNDGSYRFPLVPPGTYTVEVKAANFATVRISGIVVEASQTVPLSRQLELAKAQQVIEVTEQVPLVQTATSDLGFQVDSSTIQHAALVDRDVFDVLPFLAPQVSPGLDMSPTSGGAREAGTSYMLNGAEDNNNFSAGAININPPLESVEDFSILTNSMSAQYGRGAGALVSANQKSGSNKLHGVAYEQNRNATLNANDFFYNRDLGRSIGTPDQLPKRPKYIKNQFGGTIGGPIKKDKTFFFFAYDRLKLLQGATSFDNPEPTSAALAYLQANGGPLAQQILNPSSGYPPITSNLPCPGNETVTGGPSAVNNNGINPANGLPWPAGCLSFSDPVTTTTNTYYGRVDHNFSNSDRLSFVANINRLNIQDKFGGGGLLANGGNIPATTTLNNHNLALIETHTFSPRVANEVTVSHNRFFNPAIEGNPAKQTAPQIIIDNQSEASLGYSFGPSEGGQVVAFTQGRWALQDGLTWNVGRHAFKFGGSANYGILYRNWDLGLPGDYEFGELYSVNVPTIINGQPFYPSSNPFTPNIPACPANGPIMASCDPGSNSVAPGTNPANPSGNIPVLQSGSAATFDQLIANVISETNSNFTYEYPYFQETSINPADGSKANAYRHYTTHDYAVYFQDDWKATSRLTLNLGVRWDRYGAPSETHGIVAQFTNLGGCDVAHDAACISAARVNPTSRMWKTYNKDFAPRVGFAWDPFGKGKMAVRGGFGIYYDRIFDNIWSNGAWNPPFYALIDFQNDIGDSVFYHNPPAVGAAYDPTNPIPHPGKRVSVRTMDVNMRDSSGQNFYLSVERQFFGGLLLRSSYQGSLGRHLPMLENYNRVDGIAYYRNMVQLATNPSATPIPNLSLTPIRPNPLYTGFNYRSNSVSSNYNSLVLEAQKRMGHGLEFQTGYTYSKLLDVNSELFAGCSAIGGNTAPYYYISNARPQLSYGRAAYDHRHSYKFNVTYELPFLKGEKGFVGHALGGWSLGSFLQLYSGHPIDVWDGRTRFRARTTIPFNGTTCTNPSGCSVLLLDQNGVPFNLGGDYNLDRVQNDHPIFIGNLNSVYSGANPADGIFVDNNIIGCGAPWLPANVANVGSCNARFGVVTPNSLFVTPPYPTSGPLYERFGTLGRDVFHGPRFVSLDFGLHKTFKLTETANLRFSADAQNLANHPNFDGVVGDLSSGKFGRAQLLVGTASRVMSLSLRLAF